MLLMVVTGEARAEFCALYVTTQPSGADVFINGRFVSKSPFSHQANHPVQLRVRIVKPGYRTWEQVVELGLNQIQALHVDLIPAPKR